jgi:hypothetical protein
MIKTAEAPYVYTDIVITYQSAYMIRSKKSQKLFLQLIKDDHSKLLFSFV